MTVITVSRQMGSMGDDIAQSLARKLGWDLIRRDTLVERFFPEVDDAQELRLLHESARHFLKPGPDGRSYRDVLNERLHEECADHPAVLVGFGSQMLFAGEPGALHIRVSASRNVRLGRVRKEYHMNTEEADRVLKMSDRRHRRFVSSVYDADLSDTTLYDLVLNTDALTIDEAVACLSSLCEARNVTCALQQETKEIDAVDHTSEKPVFKNESEREFADILDMFQIEWRYEPRTFPVEWDAEGNVTMAFSPDFYLPNFDTYLELTTMNQKYVTMKNRKANKVREMYPGVNVKIVYKRDFLSLIERFRQDRDEAGDGSEETT